MTNKGSAPLVTLLLMMVTLSGCLAPEDSQISDPTDEEPILGPIDERECFEFDSMERCWLIHIPETATPEFCKENSCPLLLDMHGRGVTAELQDDLSDYPRITDEENVILVHPEGIGWGWNFGWCCSEEDDIGFLLELIDTLIENRSADGDRVYMTGWSNGCYMSQEMASVASDRIAAIACMAGYTEEPVQPDYSAIPIMEIHGLSDQLLLYGHSSTASLQVAGTLEGDEGAIQNLYWWADANDCPGIVPDFEEVEWDYSIKKFTGCANDTEVVLYTMNYAQHNPYLNDYDGADDPFFQALLTGNPTGIDASKIAWDFMSQYSKEIVSEE